jgi:hypothetical protein
MAPFLPDSVAFTLEMENTVLPLRGPGSSMSGMLVARMLVARMLVASILLEMVLLLRNHNVLIRAAGRVVDFG